MANLLSYLALCRVSNLPTVWSNAAAAALLCSAPVSGSALCTLIASLSFFYTGGMALNDLCDAQYDRVHRPERPIAAGRITLNEARLATFLLFAAGSAGLATLPRAGAAAGAAAALFAVIVLYDLYHKGNPLSVLLMAGCRFLVYLVAGLGLAGELNRPLLALGLIQFGYIILLSLAARYENLLPRLPYPPIPLLIAAICLVDGAFLSIWFTNYLWLLAGAAGMLATLFGQRYVRGD